MSFNRKQGDRKINNFVAKHDNNRGGFHGKTTKQTRCNMKVDLSRVDLDDEQTWYEIEEDYSHD